MTTPLSARKVHLVGSRIRELRKGRRLTQTELSEKIGVAQSDLSRMEQGEYKVGLDTLFKILQVFDLKMGEFFGETSQADEAAARELVTDFESLSADAQRDVRDFVRFKKKMQQEQEAASAASTASTASTQPDAPLAPETEETP
ncbi:MAG: helix-turn-helix domain-containing protein [Acidobacteriota bacterium]|nr:helix-turn-helix domain-containing protein [Acidobacteriota bacterium]